MLPLLVLVPLLATAPQGTTPSIPPSALQMTAQRLGAADAAAVEAYVSSWIGGLESSDATEVARGRMELLKPLGTPGVTAAFRLAYAAVVVPRLEAVAKEGSLFQATNALEVAQALASPESVRFLVSMCDPQAQPKAQLRIVASGALATSASQSLLTSASVDEATRTLGRALDHESNWIAALGELKSVIALASTPRLNPGSFDSAIGVEFDSLTRMASRASKGGEAAQLMQAIWRVMGDVRAQYAATPAGQLQSFRQKARPAILAIGAACKSPPPSTPEVGTAFQETAKAADTLTRILGADDSPSAKAQPAGPG